MYDCLTSISTLCCILTLPIRSVSLALSVFSASPFVGLSRSLSLSLSLSRSPSACASSTLDIDALPSSQWYAAAWSAKKDFFPVDDPAWSGWATWTRFRVDPVDWAATPALLVEHDDAQIKQRHLDGEFILGGLSDHVLPQYATVPNAKAVMIDVENGSLSAGLMYMRVALAAVCGQHDAMGVCTEAGRTQSFSEALHRSGRTVALRKGILGRCASCR